MIIKEYIVLILKYIFRLFSKGDEEDNRFGADPLL